MAIIHHSTPAPTHLKNLRDHFLLAMPSLRESIFSHSITYICDHDERGTMGIIINQTMDISVEDLFDHLEIPTSRDFSQEPVLAGGPVDEDHGFILHRKSADSWDASLDITDDIQLTSSRDLLCAIASEKGPSEYLMALGYAGWGAGQLEQELADNHWLILPATNDILFSTPYDKRLIDAAGILGVDINLISPQAGHA